MSLLGGPLACDGKLVGVTSNGVECARERFPGIYIDVNYYRGWIINGTIGNNNFSKLYVNLITILSAIFILIKLK
jgi:secreted trypsin-like serine protease